MDSYIVRIYRRAENDSQGLVGIIEKAGSGKNAPFKTIEELWTLLNAVADDPDRAAIGWRKGNAGRGTKQKDEK